MTGYTEEEQERLCHVKSSHRKEVKAGDSATTNTPKPDEDGRARAASTPHGLHRACPVCSTAVLLGGGRGWSYGKRSPPVPHSLKFFIHLPFQVGGHYLNYFSSTPTGEGKHGLEAASQFTLHKYPITVEHKDTRKEHRGGDLAQCWNVALCSSALGRALGTAQIPRLDEAAGQQPGSTVPRIWHTHGVWQKSHRLHYCLCAKFPKQSSHRSVTPKAPLPVR